MKISSFRVQNFRSIVDTQEIDCKNMMVFIGRNNAGKSNILKALDIFFNAGKPDINDIPFFASDGDEISISVCFDGIKPELKKELNISEEKLILTKNFRILKNNSSIKVSSVTEKLNGEELKNFKQNFSGITELRNYLKDSLPKYYYVPALRNLADEEKFKRGSLIQELLLPSLDDALADDEENIQSHIESIKTILQKRAVSIETEISDFLRYRVDDFDKLLFDMSTLDLKKALAPNVLVKSISSDSLLPALFQGAGTQNFIILALAQYYARGTSPVDLIIAFEEPEISLHSTAQRNMLDMIFQILENERQQIFLTTHSTIFIDRTLENVCLITKKAGKSIITIPSRSKEIINQLGIRGSDYLTSDALIFVEGASDYEVFTLWANAKAPPLWQKYTFTFVPLGGLPSIENFRIEDCRNLCNHVYAILDSDKSYPDDRVKRKAREIIQKITQELGGHVKILQRRELENYFSENAVRELFPNALEKINSALFLDDFARMKNHLTEIIQEQHYIDNRHRSDYSNDFTKQKSYSPYYAKLLAQKMVELEEIPSEFIDIINELASDLAKKLPKY